jgi:hypothetical protein
MINAIEKCLSIGARNRTECARKGSERYIIFMTWIIGSPGYDISISPKVLKIMRIVLVSWCHGFATGPGKANMAKNTPHKITPIDF